MAEELAVSRELVAKIRRQLIESRQIPNLPGRVGADGKLYTSAGLPKEPASAPQGAAGSEDERPSAGVAAWARRLLPGSNPRASRPPSESPTRTADRGGPASTGGRT